MCDGSSQQADAWRPTAEGGPSFPPLSCEFLESEPSDPATCVNMENTDHCGAGGAYMPILDAPRDAPESRIPIAGQGGMFLRLRVL